jgi:hypothetical protein
MQIASQNCIQLDRTAFYYQKEGAEEGGRTWVNFRLRAIASEKEFAFTEPECAREFTSLIRMISVISALIDVSRCSRSRRDLVARTTGM